MCILTAWTEPTWGNLGVEKWHKNGLSSLIAPVCLNKVSVCLESTEHPALVCNQIQGYDSHCIFCKLFLKFTVGPCGLYQMGLLEHSHLPVCGKRL